METIRRCMIHWARRRGLSFRVNVSQVSVSGVCVPPSSLPTPSLTTSQQIAAVMEGMATSSHVTDSLLNFPFHYHNATACPSLPSLLLVRTNPISQTTFAATATSTPSTKPMSNG